MKEGQPIFRSGSFQMSADWTLLDLKRRIEDLSAWKVEAES